MKMLVMSLAAIALTAARAEAGSAKPTAAEAKAAATAWMEAIDLDGGHGDEPEPPPAAAIALSVVPFQSVVLEDGPDPDLCAMSTATDAASLTKALACLRAQLQRDGSIKPWTKKTERELPTSFKKPVKALAKTSTLVNLEMPCAGSFNQIVFAVTKDKDGAAKISAVLSVHGLCGE